MTQFAAIRRALPGALCVWKFELMPTLSGLTLNLFIPDFVLQL